MIQADGNAEFLEHAEGISVAGGGFMRFMVCLPGDYRDITQRAAIGEFDAQLILEAWRGFGRFISAQPRGARVRCPLCPQSLKRRRFAFGLAVPYGVDSPEEGMTFGLCEKCAPDRDVAEASGHRAMRQIYPEMQTFNVHPIAGNG